MAEVLKPPGWIEPKNLRWARERLRLSLEDVEQQAKKLGRQFYEAVTAAQIRQWEQGEASPSLAQLETLAEIYACPVGYFFLDQPPETAKPISFRGLSAPKAEGLSSETLKSLEHFYSLVEWTVGLLRSWHEGWAVRIRPQEVTGCVEEAERWAGEYRRRFGWNRQQREQLGQSPKEAFHWWRRKLEQWGIFCFEMPLNPKEIRGASVWKEGYPFILVNHQDREAAAGRLFTLLHELGHLISASEEGIACDFRGAGLHRNPEPFANRFAANILLLPEELQEHLTQIGENRPRKNWPDRLLDRIRKPFMVSRDVAAILLQQLQLAPKDFYQRKLKSWERQKTSKPWRRGLSKKEQVLQRLGYGLSGLLARASQLPDFSWTDASLLVGMKVEKTEEFFQWVRQKTP